MIFKALSAIRCAFGAMIVSFFAQTAAAQDAGASVRETLNGERAALVALRAGPFDTTSVAGRLTPVDGETDMGHLTRQDRVANALLGDTVRSTRAAIDSTVAAGARAWDAFRSVTAAGGEHWKCLTEALYFEARGEGLSGQIAVAEVILNRVDSKRFPDTVCDVVMQGTGRKHACQFSYTCDGKSEVIGDQAAFTRAGKIARVMLDGRARLLTGDATHYHAASVKPHWAKVFARTARIGSHIFYRAPDRLASN